MKNLFELLILISFGTMVFSAENIPLCIGFGALCGLLTLAYVNIWREEK